MISTFSKRLLRVFYRPRARRAARQALVGRARDRTMPERGRFTRPEVDELVERAWAKFEEIEASEPGPDRSRAVLLGFLTHAMFQVLREIGLDRGYAIELLSDVTWVVFSQGNSALYRWAGLVEPHPLARLRRVAGLAFRLLPGGYQYAWEPATNGVTYVVRRCPVADYFLRQGASDVCVGTWCDLDYGLGELWGGRLDRDGTLASGAEQCDFRFTLLNDRQASAEEP